MSHPPSSVLSKEEHTGFQIFSWNFIADLNDFAGIRLLHAVIQEAWELKTALIKSAKSVFRDGLPFACSMEHLVKVDIIQLMHILVNLVQGFEQASFLIAKLLSIHVRNRSCRLRLLCSRYFPNFLLVRISALLLTRSVDPELQRSCKISLNLRPFLHLPHVLSIDYCLFSTHFLASPETVTDKFCRNCQI